MKKLLTVFNHILSEEQFLDAKENLFVSEVVGLPKNLRDLWANIPPDGNFPDAVVLKISKWIENNLNQGDFVLIQGEFGVSFFLVDFCFKSGFIPVYSTSKRVSKETILDDGSVKKINFFRHVQFRRYKRAF